MNRFVTCLWYPLLFGNAGDAAAHAPRYHARRDLVRRCAAYREWLINGAIGPASGSDMLFVMALAEEQRGQRESQFKTVAINYASGLFFNLDGWVRS